MVAGGNDQAGACRAGRRRCGGTTDGRSDTSPIEGESDGVSGNMVVAASGATPRTSPTARRPMPPETPSPAWTTDGPYLAAASHAIGFHPRFDRHVRGHRESLERERLHARIQPRYV